MPYQWLLFDADNTLFDYEAGEEMALSKSFDEAGIPFLSEYEEVYAEVNAALWRQFEKGQVTLADLRTARFSQLFERLAIQSDATAVQRNLSPFPWPGNRSDPGCIGDFAGPFRSIPHGDYHQRHLNRTALTPFAFTNQTIF